MLRKIELDNSIADGKYLYINVLTRRARDLSKGSKPTIPYAEGNFDPIDVAYEELESGKLDFGRRHEVSGEIEDF